MRKPGNDGEAAAPAVASSVAAWVWVGRAGGGVSRDRGIGGVSGGGANEGGAVAVVWGVSYTEFLGQPLAPVFPDASVQSRRGSAGR